MKNIKSILLPIVAIFIVAIGANAADKYSVNRNDLPAAAQQFLNKHFANSKVSMVKTDTHFLKATDYDVKLVDGTSIEFDAKGNWTSVDCKYRKVPTAIIQKNIQNYVNKNFTSNFIVSIEKEKTGYEIELNDGIELKFDRLGKFKSMKTDD